MSLDSVKKELANKVFYVKKSDKFFRFTSFKILENLIIVDFLVIVVILNHFHKTFYAGSVVMYPVPGSKNISRKFIERYHFGT